MAGRVAGKVVLLTGGAMGLGKAATKALMAEGATVIITDINAEAGLATAAQVAKIEGVAANATANASDVALRDRTTHTGEQAISTISGLSSLLRRPLLW